MKEKKTSLLGKLQKYRYIGTKGTKIKMHRALRKLTFSPSILCTIIILPIFFDAMLWFNLNTLMEVWETIFNFCIDKLALHGHVSYYEAHLLNYIVIVPFPDIETTLPTVIAVWINIALCLISAIISDFIPKKYLPLTYIFRAALLIQIASSFYYLLSPNHPPFTLANYISGVLTSGMYLLFLLTPVLALIYYIFDMGFWRKCFASAIIVLYFMIAIPFQYMLHAYIISSWSLLFMPVLYLLLGSMVDVLMFISLYSLALSWRKQEQ